MAEGGTALQWLNTLEDEGRTGDGGSSSKTVEVRGFSLDTSYDLLEMYFENTRRSGGGDIEEIEIKDDVAYITFEVAEVVQRVVSNSPHQVAGQTLTATLFCPSLQKPSYENRVLVQRLNSSVTEELLTIFLEKETGMNVVEFLYGEEEGKVVVTFSNIIDFAALRKACSKRRLEGTFIQVTKVAISNCIFVKNLLQATSNELILFYFENKRSGGGEVERVEMNEAERYCLVYFVDHNVIDTVLCLQHKIDGADIEVHLHHECLGRRSSRNRYDPFLGMSKPDVKDILKAETSSSVSSNTEKGCDFVETQKWQEDDGKNCVLPLWIKYKRASERTISKNIKEIPCSWNFHVLWNFFAKTKQGQQMLDDILKKCGCSVTVSSDDDDLFIFEISDKRFQKESEVIDFIKDTMGDVYTYAQQYLFSDIFLVDHRMQEDILQRVKQAKEMDSAWIELIGEQEPDAICVVCSEKDKVLILQVVTAIKNAVEDCFENHQDVVTIDPMWQKVLKKFGYLQEMSVKFPNLTMTPDKTKATIMLKGPRDQSNAAAKYLMELLGTAHADVQEDIFSPGCQFDIFKYPEMYDYINKSITKLPFVWIPNCQTMKIHLFYKKSEQIMGMDKFIKGCIKERPYPLTSDQSVCCPKIASSLEDLKKKHKGKIVINQSPTGIILTTADDIFESVDAVVAEIISTELGKIQPAHVPEKYVKRDGQLVNKTEYSMNQEKPEDSMQRKENVSSEQKTKASEGLTSVPVSFDLLEVMIQPDIKEKPCSDGITNIEERPKSEEDTCKNKLKKCHVQTVGLQDSDKEISNESWVKPESCDTDIDSIMTKTTYKKHGTIDLRDRCNNWSFLYTQSVEEEVFKQDSQRNNPSIQSKENIGSHEDEEGQIDVCHSQQYPAGDGESDHTLRDLGIKDAHIISQPLKENSMTEISNTAWSHEDHSVHNEGPLLPLWMPVKDKLIKTEQPQPSTGISAQRMTVPEAQLIIDVYPPKLAIPQPSQGVRSQDIMMATGSMNMPQPHAEVSFEKLTIPQPNSNTHLPNMRILQSITGLSVERSVFTKIRVKVQKGQLHIAQAEVLVNTVNRNLDLTKERISSSLLMKTGSGIQKELFMLKKENIAFGQVLKTGVGYLPLPCRVIFHGTLYAYKEHPGSLKVFKNFLLSCLEEANKKYRSIAFPPIGTGGLGYPKDLVASLMFESVAEFEHSHPITKLEEVKFVIYEKDQETLKEFEMMYMRYFGASLEPQGASPNLSKNVPPKAIAVKPTSHVIDGLLSEDCSICSEDAKSPKTLSCGHTFCIKCIEEQFRTKPVCPKCETFHGTIYGDQPEGGKLSISIQKHSLAGFEKCDTLQIKYHIPSGYQGPSCQKPGMFYESITRTAYLPDTTEGRKVCELLKVAFRRRLIFTLGRSKWGLYDMIWNDIHHKTEVCGENGYPDPGYLKRIQEQLAAKGVTEADLQTEV